MKRTCLKIATLFIPATILTTWATGAPYTGIGPGQSTIGTGGDYASLHDACEAISSTPLTGGPWEFLILNDLEEPVNSSLTQPASEGHEITIRPAPGTTPTVRFTTTEVPNILQWYAMAHLLVGIRPGEGALNSEWIPTHRITIDGSNVPGGNSRDLTFENTAGAGARTIIKVAGACETVQVKNMNLVSHGVPGNYESVSYLQGAGVEFASQPQGPWGSASAIISGSVLNCKMIYHGAQKASGINLENSDLNLEAQDVATAFTARGNEIIGFFSGIVATGFKELNITDNVLHFNPGINHSWRTAGLQVRFWVDAGAVTIARNRITFDQYENTVGITGIELDGVEDSQISLENNIISGGFSGAGNRYGLTCGVSMRSTVALSHNSIHLGGNDGNLDSAAVAIRRVGSGPPGTFLLRNNIFNAAMPRSYVLQTSSVLNLDSNYNNLVAADQSSIALHDDSVIEDLAAWQAQGMDANSISINPFEPATPGLGTWAGNPGDSSLLFTSFPGADYLVPALDDVSVDINGTPRPGPQVLMGAHEIAADETNVEDWRLY